METAKRTLMLIISAFVGLAFLNVTLALLETATGGCEGDPARNALWYTHRASYALLGRGLITTQVQWDRAYAALRSAFQYIGPAFYFSVWFVGTAFCHRRLIRKHREDIRRARIAAGKCEFCEYDLTGNTSGVCPECGHPISPKDVHAAPRSRGADVQPRGDCVPEPRVGREADYPGL